MPDNARCQPYVIITPSSVGCSGVVVVVVKELTCRMGSHSVTGHPAEVTFPPLSKPKLVLDLATPEGCKAELTYCSKGAQLMPKTPSQWHSLYTVRGEIRTLVLSHRSRAR